MLFQSTVLKTRITFVVALQSLSYVQLFVTTWTAAHQVPLSSTVSQSLLKFMSVKLVMLLTISFSATPFSFLPSIFPSIRVFPNKLAFHIRWPKYWNFSFSISFSNEYSGLTSFRIDWFNLLAVQGTLRKNHVVVQSLSRVQLLVMPWTAAPQPSLSITNSQSFLKLMSIQSVMPSNHLILCHPLLLLPSIFPA